MSVVAALAAGAVQDVEAGGVHWRLRRVRSIDLLAAGGNGLLAMLPRLAAEQQANPQALLAELASRPDMIADQIGRREALVCASVEAASTDGQVWEPVRLVLEVADAATEQGRVHISALTPTVITALARAVHEHAIGRWGLLPGAGAVDPGQSGETVRENAG